MDWKLSARNRSLDNQLTYKEFDNNQYLILHYDDIKDYLESIRTSIYEADDVKFDGNLDLLVHDGRIVVTLQTIRQLNAFSHYLDKIIDLNQKVVFYDEMKDLEFVYSIIGYSLKKKLNHNFEIRTILDKVTNAKELLLYVFENTILKNNLEITTSLSLITENDLNRLSKNIFDITINQTRLPLYATSFITGMQVNYQLSNEEAKYLLNLITDHEYIIKLYYQEALNAFNEIKLITYREIKDLLVATRDEFIKAGELTNKDCLNDLNCLDNLDVICPRAQMIIDQLIIALETRISVFKDEYLIYENNGSDSRFVNYVFNEYNQRIKNKHLINQLISETKRPKLLIKKVFNHCFINDKCLDFKIAPAKVSVLNRMIIELSFKVIMDDYSKKEFIKIGKTRYGLSKKYSLYIYYLINFFIDDVKEKIAILLK